MGHVPSLQLICEPFVLDLHASKNSAAERLVALALTKHNFHSPNDPLFQNFAAARGEIPIRQWYCRPKGLPMSQLPDAPSAEYLFQRLVEPATAICNLKLPPSQFVPIPLVIVKMDDRHSWERPTATNCSIVGYFGCRGFNESAQIGEFGVLGMFLCTRFYNEAKSQAVIQLACKCYQHFARKAGCVTVPWPESVRFDTLCGNLPCLRLAQQLYFFVESEGLDTDGAVMVAVEGERAFFSAFGPEFHRACELYTAYTINGGDKASCNFFKLRPKPSVAAPNLNGGYIQELQTLIAAAKANWAENNAVVTEFVQQTRQRKQSLNIADEIGYSQEDLQSGNRGPRPPRSVDAAAAADSICA